MAAVEQITAPLAYHGEGPCWWPGWDGLRYVDMLAGDVLSLDPASGSVARQHVGEVVAVVRPRGTGGAILALQDSFAVTDGPLTELRTIACVEQGAGIRLNEGGCDPDGHFYCGSMASDETPNAGKLYRVDADGNVDVVFDAVSVSNGLDFSPDGTSAYYIDSANHGIDVFDYSSETGISERRRFVDIPPEAGVPDGLVVDAEGGIWVAMMFGGSVRRFSSSGDQDAVIDIPVPGVTACTFGGDNLTTLYITTSHVGVDVEAHPQSGALFSVEPGVRGRPTLPFKL